jgi:GNAT superfamily N-acetyltransferase
MKTTYTLEMRSPGDLRPVRASLPGLRIERMQISLPELNKFFHTVIGHAYRWSGRRDWTKEDWYAHANRDEMETWVAYVAGTPAGYFEIEKGSEGDVHIVNFGLLPQFIGRGLGGHLLTRAVERAWDWGATRVWVSTCSHDHSHALQNYLARGFQIRETTEGPPNPPVKSFWSLMTEGAEL